MTMDVLEILRNIYGAGEGAAHPSAVSAALYGLLWNQAWDSALAASQASYDAGGTWDEQREAFRSAFKDSLGWSDAEWHEYWSNPAYKGDGRDAQQFDESWDTFDAFIEQMRRGGR